MQPIIVATSFSPYSLEHLAPILISTLFIIALLRLGRQKSLNWRAQLGGWISLVIPLMIVRDMVEQLGNQNLNLGEDLPCHLCRLVCFFLPIALFKQSKTWIGILYFLVLAGTMQAVATPDLKEGFPDYLYIRYWVLHAGLIALTIYAVIVLEVKPSWKDFGRAVVAAQVYLVFTLPLNYLVDGNYGYTCQKPPVASIADYMGPWPWYILTGEAIMLVLFLLLLIPFRLGKKVPVVQENQS